MSGRCQMYLDDLFNEHGVASYSSGETPTLPRANASDSLPGKPFQQWEAQAGGGAFEITTNVNALVYIDEGGGTTTVRIPGAFYPTVSAFVAYLTTEINTPGNVTSGPALAGTYAVTYNTSSRKFTITEGAASSFALPNATSTTDNMLTLLLGWDATDVSGTFVYQADTERSSTITWLKYEQPVGETIAPNLIALMLSSVGGTDDDNDVLYNDCTVYAHATDLGSQQANWEGTASLTLAVSDRPANPENTLQGAVTTDATGYRYWVVYWKHVDDHEFHRINICRGMESVGSATRTCREIQRQGLEDPTSARTLNNQHPTELKKRWLMTAELERWEVADFRAFVVAAQRYGKVEGMVWALRGSAVLAGTYTITDEADNGTMFYGTILDWPPSGYSTAGSDRLTGSLTFGQLVP